MWHWDSYLMPNLRVESVSDAFELLGEQQQSSAIREFPPCDTRNHSKIENKLKNYKKKTTWGKVLTRASCRMRVSLESRYGMWFALLDEPLVRAFITFPKAESDLLMVFASSRTLPSAPVLSAFSEPARSTSISFPVFTLFKCRIHCIRSTITASEFLWLIMKKLYLLSLTESCWIVNK